MHCWALHALSTAQPSQQHHSPAALDTQPICNGKLCQHLLVAKFNLNMPYSQAHQETALCFDCCKKSCSLCAFSYSNAFHASCVGCVMNTICKFLQPAHVHLLLACPTSAVWWAMLHFQFTDLALWVCAKLL